MLFRLDFQSGIPIYKQIRDQVVLAVSARRINGSRARDISSPTAGTVR